MEAEAGALPSEVISLKAYRQGHSLRTLGRELMAFYF